MTEQEKAEQLRRRTESRNASLRYIGMSFYQMEGIWAFKTEDYGQVEISAHDVLELSDKHFDLQFAHLSESIEMLKGKQDTFNKIKALPSEAEQQIRDADKALIADWAAKVSQLMPEDPNLQSEYYQQHYNYFINAIDDAVSKLVKLIHS